MFQEPDEIALSKPNTYWKSCQGKASQHLLWEEKNKTKAQILHNKTEIVFRNELETCFYMT